MSRPPSVVERYFKCRYRADVKDSEGEDQLILTHSNRISVICIAESHPILKDKKSISSVDFDVNGVNRLAIRVSGKGKKGSQSVKPQTILCKVKCEDGSDYSLRSCVKGQMIEANENICRQPQLLSEKPRGTGYIAVILPNFGTFEKDMQNLKTESEYQTVLQERSQAAKADPL